MNIKKLVIGLVSTNTYLVWNNKKEAIIIDPAANDKLIIKTIKEENLDLKAILLTHGHFDHIGAVEGVANEFNVKIYAHQQEKELLYKPELNHSTALASPISIEADILLKDKDIINIADFEIEVIHTPGHTAGSVCYLFTDEKRMFSGDTLFFEEIGRWDLPTGNSADLLNSLNKKLMLLDDDIIVYPGHDRETSIGHERLNNQYID